MQWKRWHLQPCDLSPAQCLKINQTALWYRIVSFMRTDLVQLHPIAFHPLWSEKEAVRHDNTSTMHAQQDERLNQTSGALVGGWLGLGLGNRTHRSIVASWRPGPTRHDCFHLGNRAWAQCEVNDASVCYGHDILKSHLN